jgi:hypothetical protein
MLEGVELVKDRWAPNYATYSCANGNSGEGTVLANTFGDHQWLFNKVDVKSLWPTWTAYDKRFDAYTCVISYSWYYPLCMTHDPSKNNAVHTRVVRIGSDLQYDVKSLVQYTSPLFGPGVVDPAARLLWIVMPLRRAGDVIYARIYPFAYQSSVFDFGRLSGAQYTYPCLTASSIALMLNNVNGSDSQVWQVEPYNFKEDGCSSNNYTSRANLLANRVFATPGMCNLPPLTINGMNEGELVITTTNGISVIPTELFDQNQGIMVIRRFGANRERYSPYYLFANYQFTTSGDDDDVFACTFGYTGNPNYSKNPTVGFPGADHPNCNGPGLARCHGYKTACMWSILANRLRNVGGMRVAELIMKASFGNYVDSAYQTPCVHKDNKCFVHVFAYPVAIYTRSVAPLPGTENTQGNVFRLFCVRTALVLGEHNSPGDPPENIWRDENWTNQLFGWLSSEQVGISSGNPDCLFSECEDEYGFADDLRGDDVCASLCLEHQARENYVIEVSGVEYDIRGGCVPGGNEKQWCDDTSGLVVQQCVADAREKCIGGGESVELPVRLVGNINDSTAFEFIGLSASNYEFFTDAKLGKHNDCYAENYNTTKLCVDFDRNCTPVAQREFRECGGADDDIYCRLG